jgi:PKHD-type hydroxylase
MSDLVNYSYWKWDAILSKEFCHSALEQIDWATSGNATLGNDKNNPVIDTKIRRTDVVWQDPTQPLGCIAKCYMEMANQSAEWGYNLSSQEETQLGRYKSVDEGYYDWHMDAGPPQNGVQRKLSCVILLNDPSEFEGGILQFKGMEDRNLLDKQGSIIVFPSFVEHKVTPVTKGVRYTAVTWASGPSFR